MSSGRDRTAAIVTGASRGIGAAIAEKLSADGYGVAVNYGADADGAESVVSSIRGQGGRAVAVRADVAAPDDVGNMFEVAQLELGPLAALVNNAGTAGAQMRLDEQDADQRSTPSHRPTRRDRGGGVVVDITGGVVRHGKRYHRLRRFVTACVVRSGRSIGLARRHTDGAVEADRLPVEHRVGNDLRDEEAVLVRQAQA
jgi:hypothetical protein